MTKKTVKPKTVKPKTVKPKTVDDWFKQLCKQDQVFIPGIGCVQEIIKPKEKKIERRELDTCVIKAPKIDPIYSRAVEKLYKQVYKDKEAKMRYNELIGPSREEIQSK